MKIKALTVDGITNIIFHLIAVILIMLVMYPLWFILIASFSNPADVAMGRVLFWPEKWSLAGYRELFKQSQIWRSYLNTILYTAAGTFIALAVNLPAGYAMSRGELAGKKGINIFYMIPMFFAGGLIPTYFVIQAFGLLNTFWVMVLPFSVSTYNIIVARTFFQNSLPVLPDIFFSLRCPSPRR